MNSTVADICKSSEFMCGNLQCVSLDRVCDSKDDCGDYSDELQCDSATRKYQEPGIWNLESHYL